jgi:uncharacterized membrane protein
MRLRRFEVALALILTLGSLIGLTGMTWLVLTAPAARSYVTDIVSLTDEEATLVLTRHNPYIDSSAYRIALARYPGALGTPLRGPVFGTGYDMPALSKLVVTQQEYVSSPQRVPGAFDPRTLHSYPALSFLLYVPWLWVGGQNILAVSLMVYWAVFAWLVWLTPIGWRHWGALVALAAVPTVLASLIESNEIICIALVLLAWHLRGRRWIAAAVLLGLACAFKQYVWFFVPIFAVEVVRGQGWRAAMRWAIAGMAAFLLPNLPYLLASPHAWLASLGTPMTEPLFAVGIGVVQLSTSHALPFGPPALYALLEAATLVVTLAIAVRSWPRLGDGMLVLALVPLYFAFRSTPNYFAFVPWLALYAVNVRAREVLEPRTSPTVLAAARVLYVLSPGHGNYGLLRRLPNHRLPR